MKIEGINNIEELATVSLNSNVTKASRKNAHKHYQNLLFGEDGTREQRNSAIALYKMLLPPAPSKPKTGLDWVRKAVAKKDVRYYLNELYSDGSRNMGTDGNRLHIDTENPLPEGWYDKELNKVDLKGKYPDVDRIIPGVSEATTYLNKLIVEPSFHSERVGFIVKLTFSPEVGEDIVVAVNKTYWDQALSGLSNPLVSTNGENSVVMLEEGSRLAILSPIRV